MENNNYVLNKISDSCFEVKKDGDSAYKLVKVNGLWSCTCTGYYYRGTCKHIDMLKGKVADSEIGSVEDIHTLGEIEKVVDSVKETMCNTLKYEFSGDYRRGMDFITTLPIIVECNEDVFNGLTFDIERFKITLRDKSIIRGYYDRIPVVFIRADINNFATRLFLTTGSKDEVLRLKNITKSMGYKLVEEGLFDAQGNIVNIMTEEGIYSFIGEPYKEPSKR